MHLSVFVSGLFLYMSSFCFTRSFRLSVALLKRAQTIARTAPKSIETSDAPAYALGIMKSVYVNKFFSQES